MLLACFLGLFLFLFLYAKYLYFQWKESRDFFRQVDKMIEVNNKKYIESLKKSLEQSTPFIIDVIKKSAKQ